MKVEGFEGRRRQRCRKRQEKVSEGKCFKCGKSGRMSIDCKSKETNALEVDEEESLSREGMFRHGEHRVECAGDRVSASVRGKSQDSYRNRLMCSSNCGRV